MTELGQHRIFPDFKRQRARMVKLLEEQGITDEAVLAAMRTVRRHLFVPEALQGRAYEDHALPIGFGQTISQPYIVAFMSQLLEAKPGMKVLEIGTGSGYQAAVLRETSTVFAALIGWLVLGEKVGPRRTALMALIAAGAVVVEMAG